MKYMCEVCRVPHNTVKEADECELKHKIEAEKKKELNKVKNLRLDEIIAKRKELADLENKYFDDYNVSLRCKSFPLFNVWSM